MNESEEEKKATTTSEVVWFRGERVGVTTNPRDTEYLGPEQKVVDAFLHTSIAQIKSNKGVVPETPELSIHGLNKKKWLKYRADFIKALQLIAKNKDKVLGRMRLYAIGLDPGDKPKTSTLQAMIDRWCIPDEYRSYFIKQSKGYFHTTMITGREISSDIANRMRFKILDAKTLALPESDEDVRDPDDPELTFRRAVFGEGEGSIEGCDGNERSFLTCFLAHCRYFIRLWSDVQEWLPLINDIVDACTPSGPNRLSQYTLWRAWLLGHPHTEKTLPLNKDKKKISRCPWGKGADEYIRKGNFFRDEQLNRHSHAQTQLTRSRKLNALVKLVAKDWFSFIQELYQAMLAEAEGWHSGLDRAPHPIFRPSERLPLWGLQLFLIMALLGTRPLEAMKWSELITNAELPPEEVYIDEKDMSELVKSKHVIQKRVAKRGSNPTREPREQEYNQDAQVLKPIALLTAQSNDVLLIFRHMRHLLNRHLQHRLLHNPEATKLSASDRPLSDYLSYADPNSRALILAEEKDDQEKLRARRAQIAKSSTKQARKDYPLRWVRDFMKHKRIERAWDEPTQFITNDSLTHAFGGAGFTYAFGYLVERFEERSKNSEHIGNPYLLRSIYAEAAFNLYAREKGIAKSVFLSQVLGHIAHRTGTGHTVAELNSQLHYQRVMFIEQPRRQWLKPDAEALLQQINDAFQDLTRQVRDMPRAQAPQPPPPPPRPAAPPPARAAALTKRQQLARQAYFFVQKNSHKRVELQTTAFWISAGYTEKPARRFGRAVQTLIENQPDISGEQLAADFAELVGHY